MADLPPLDRCPNGHEIQDVAILCPEPGCGSFILVTPSVHGERRIQSLAQGALIVLATVMAFLMLRYTVSIWPIYVFLVLGIIHLYATIFTRGAVLGRAMWLLVAAAVGWVVWQIITDVVHLHVTLGPANAQVLRALPVLAWLLLTAYMLQLGQQALQKIQTASTYFLAAATFTLGFWGVWVFYLENGLVNQGIYHTAIGVGILLPLLCVTFLFAIPARSTPAREWLMNRAAVSMLVAATYLTVLEPLVKIQAFVLGRFFPRALGLDSLTEPSTQWLGGLNWRTLVTSVLLLVALAIIAVQGALEATTTEAQTAERPGSQTRFIARLLGETGWEIAKNLAVTIRRTIQVQLPVLAFTLLSMLIVLVLSKFAEYLVHGPFLMAVSLWGMSLSILVAVVVLCGVAFDFVPSRLARPSDAWKRRRLLGVPIVVIATASLLGSLCYSLVSLASSALLPMLWPTTGTSLWALFTGDIYFTNLAMSLLGLGLLAGLYALSGTKWLRERPRPVLEGYFSISAAVALVALALTSLFFAFSPIRTAVEYVATRDDSAVTDRAALNRLVPLSIDATCTRDRYHLLIGNLGGLYCRDADNAGTDVTYLLFDTPERVAYWYDRTLRARSISTDTGACGETFAAEGGYDSQRPSQRYACYVDRHGAWIIWTDTDVRVLGIAFRVDGRLPALHEEWLTGSFRVRSDR